MNLTSSRSINFSLKTLFSLLISFSAFQLTVAQDLDATTIAGNVADENAAAIPGPEVLAIFEKTGTKRLTSSDTQGRFCLMQLEPGLYSLSASQNPVAIC